jgi:CheY-like chemotaxis protein
MYPRTTNCMAPPKHVTSPLPAPLVLYIDDEESDLFFMQLAFEKIGLQGALVTFTDAQQAITFLSPAGWTPDTAVYRTPNLIILDFKLPAVSDLELVGWLRSQSRFHHTPIVVFSGFASPTARSRALQLGATEFLEKPGTGTAFDQVARHLLRRWLQPAGPAPALSSSPPRLSI